jgi:hypothetical protein
VIARWLAAAKAEGTPAALMCTPSSAVRVCWAALDDGLDIAQTLFIFGGEPYVEGRARRVGRRPRGLRLRHDRDRRGRNALWTSRAAGRHASLHATRRCHRAVARAAVGRQRACALPHEPQPGVAEVDDQRRERRPRRARRARLPAVRCTGSGSPGTCTRSAATRSSRAKG